MGAKYVLQDILGGQGTYDYFVHLYYLYCKLSYDSGNFVGLILKFYGSRSLQISSFPCGNAKVVSTLDVNCFKLHAKLIRL